MSFMAGFGDAFSRSFEAGNERNARRREDLFKITYSDFISKRDEISKYKREDAKAARKAEALIEQSGVDPRAYPFVFKQVQAGVDESTLVNDLRTGNFEFSDDKESVGIESQPDSPEDADPTATQMEESGMTPGTPAAPAEPTAPAPAPVAPEASEGFSGLLPQFRGGNRAARDRARALEATAGAAGTTVEDVQGILTGAGYTPPSIDTSGIKFTPAETAQKADPMASLNEARIELDQAIASGNSQRIATAERRWNSVMTAESIKANHEARANGFALNGYLANIWKEGPDGQPEYKATIHVTEDPANPGQLLDPMGKPVDGRAVQISKQESELLEKANTSLQKPLIEQNDRVVNGIAAVRSYNVMSDIVGQTNGAVLAPVTSGTYQWAQKWMQDATIAVEQFNKTVGDGGQPTMSIEQLEGIRDRLVSEGGNDLGTQKGLFEVQKAMMAYRLGSSMGQEGRSLAETERKLFTEMASGGVTPDRFHQGMSDILMGMTRTLDGQTKSIINNDMNVRQYESQYGFRPKHYDVEPMESQIANNPEFRKAWETLKKFDRNPALQLQRKPASETSTPGTPELAPESQVPATPGRTPSQKSINALKNNPALAAEFDKTYGPGAAQRILEGQ